jgi:carbon-nitrogen hydrolase
VTTDALGAAAKAAGVQVVIGLTERDRDYSTGTLYNTLLFLGADGSILGKHRKLVPTAGERVIWGRGDGSTLEVFDTPLGRIGGLACAEHVMPLARYALHAQGEQVHVAAWPYVDDQPTLMTRFHAYEGRTFAIGVGMPLAPHLVQSPDLQDEIRGLVQAMLDNRPDVFEVTVHTSPQRPVRFDRGALAPAPAGRAARGGSTDL